MITWNLSGYLELFKWLPGTFWVITWNFLSDYLELFECLPGTFWVFTWNILSFYLEPIEWLSGSFEWLNALEFFHVIIFMPYLLFNFEFDRLFASLAKRRVHQDKFMNEFVLLSLFFSVNMCLNVPPPPSLTFTRSVTLVKHLYIDPTNTCRLFLLCICLTVILFLHWP